MDPSHLERISLDELNAVAGLLTRVDRKYLVPTASAQDLLDSLAGRARVLSVAGATSSRYASVYFDTPALDSYLLAARKRRRRFKVRTRTYLDSGLCFLEVKTRGARGATVKKRLAYDAGSAEVLTQEGRDFVAEQLAAARISVAPGRLAEVLGPVMGTTYERTTVHLPAASARLTLDTALAWQDLTGRLVGDVPAGDLAVVETKNPAAPGPADRLLWAAGHRPTRISKYATGLAVLSPELPANKWHRVMHHDLEQARRAAARHAA
ncbi:polyphosphate polymerase domain-containing protein [Actinomyces sp. 217892]|uniref:polyphosphate polymerase domain-containing protein n=1 Tax=Actinomyces sp. 217892 TaxID=2927827 RepID=UPI00202E412B|nr:polyphosphate polymerase domain-containing protein [Actinomyces sp. 217892]